MIKTILTIIFIIICVFLSAVILLQEGKSQVCPVPSAVWLTATGAEIKAVLWKESWRS